MSHGELLSIEPQNLQFAFELRKQMQCSLQLSNRTDNYVAFKVLTTNVKKYCVMPNTGVLLPRSTCDVIVWMRAQKEAPSDMLCKDKFLFQGVIVGPGATTKDINQKMFNKESGHNVEEYKLRVLYVPLPDCIVMSHGELLSIEPQELQFPFELRKQISCSLQLSNRTDNYVAFKVLTTNAKKYCVRPNTGVVLPRSTCDVIDWHVPSWNLPRWHVAIILYQNNTFSVTMQAQEKTPPDMQCNDKFLFQGVIVGPGATTKDINQETFNKESGHNVEEYKLTVLYVLPPPLPPARQGSEEDSSPRASVSDSGNFNDSEFAPLIHAPRAQFGIRKRWEGLFSCNKSSTSA